MGLLLNVPIVVPWKGPTEVSWKVDENVLVKRYSTINFYLYDLNITLRTQDAI